MTARKHNDWTIKNGSVTNKTTSETSEFGLNGEIYDIVPSGTNAGFTALIRNVVIANRIISKGLTPYDPEDRLWSGEELVVRLPIEMLSEMRNTLQIPDIERQLVIANRS